MKSEANMQKSKREREIIMRQLIKADRGIHYNGIDPDCRLNVWHDAIFCLR